jgi:His-Xaa-Ser system protein HxsD|uniref:His-Xaa-Ser system protein HxsD n=1 Tax=Desulfobacca acetoxidans TaxID=60893 RepID=A0A7C5EKJ6_9BACT
MTKTIHRDAERLVFQISKELYEKEAVFAAVYALSGECKNRIEPGPDESHVTVTLEPLTPLSEAELLHLEHRFLSGITDQQLRLDLERRFGPLRQLIVEHAFAPLAHLKEAVKKTIGRD